MEITVRSQAGVDIIELQGRFDAYEVPEIIKWFDDHPQASCVIMNLRGVNFIDSLGLSTLVKGLKRCRQNGGDLFLCNLQQAVVVIFELTRLNSAFRVFVDEQAALKAFGQQA